MLLSTATPLALPAVRLPSSPAISVSAVGARPLTAPVLLVTPAGEYELESGSILVGRSADCEVVVDDPLVSRHHARVVIEEQLAWLEDLHSTNGVYVNATRLTHRTRLCEGDRILVGTHEVSIFAGRPRAQVADAKSISTLPPPRARHSGSVAPAPSLKLRPARGNEQMPQTARADSLRIIGRLASRLAAAGQQAEAERILSGHLRRILEGANSGLLVSEESLQLACDQALDLARWTARGVWLDYIVELHLATRRVLSLQLIAGLQLARRWSVELNGLLLRYYLESLVGRADQLEPDERRRLPLVQKLTQ